MRALLLTVTCLGCSGTKPSAVSDSSIADDAAAQDIDAAGSGSGRDLSTDRTKFFGASRCAAANVALCEDFESGTISNTKWQTIGATPPVVDTIQAARGTHAMHIHMTGASTNGASYIKETSTFPALSGTYYARAFVWFAHLPTAASMTYAHWTAFASTTSIGEIRISGQFQNGKNLFGVGTDSGSNANGTGDWTNSDKDPNNAPRAVPTGEWECIEWMHDSTDSTTKFWWDATEHTSLDTTATSHGGNTNPYNFPPPTAAWFGWQEYQASTEEFELWVDEIAIDSQRIGCVI